jgi:PPOX class probable F420-dependent enzyme
MELPVHVAEALLGRWPVARLATLTPQGRPHLVPVVFARSGGDLWIPIDAKPKAGGELARVRNVRERPDATLLLDEYDPDWRRLWWLRVDARAAVIAERDPKSDFDLARVAEALRAKYRQYDELPLFRGEPLLLRLAVDRVRSWCAGPAAVEAASTAIGSAHR